MKNKKKFNIAVVIILQITIIMLQIVLIGINNKDIKLDKVKLKEIASYDNSNVSIMIYNNDKNEYEKYTGEIFPSKSEYVYSEEDSKCLDVNGTIIENAIKYFNGKVTIKTNKTSTCYLSFRPGKALTFELGEGVSKVYYKVNNDEEYIESNETTVVAVTPGTEYTYYGEAETGYVLSACTSEEDICSGTMPNEAKTETLSAGRFRIKANTGVGEIYYKLSSASTYNSTISSATINESSGTYNYYGLPSVGYKISTCTKDVPCTVTIEPGVEDKEISAQSITNTNGATYLMNLANSNTTSNLIKQSHPDSTVQTGTNQSTDYRYIGASENVNNYVCLGNLKADGSCIDEEHLYRIIGVMPTQTIKSGGYENRIKLIKQTEYLDSDKISSTQTPSGYGYRWTGQKKEGEDKYTSYSGVESFTNNWEESTLNRKILNQTFYNNLDSKYQQMIGNSVWYLGEYWTASTSDEYLFVGERSETIQSYGSKVNPKYAERKIGLIYPSDYIYATSGGNSSDRNTCLSFNFYRWDSKKDCYDNDWLFINGYIQWTITSLSNSSFYVFAIKNDGNLWDSAYSQLYIYLIRPNFYLTKDIKIISGTGSLNSPYTLSS